MTVLSYIFIAKIGCASSKVEWVRSSYGRTGYDHPGEDLGQRQQRPMSCLVGTRMFSVVKSSVPPCFQLRHFYRKIYS
jgi:hypothetical protein